jgi:hypothetical protein
MTNLSDMRASLVALHSMLISPGKHRIKVELPGYRTFENEVNLLAGQKAEVKTEFVKGASNKPSPAIKPPQWRPDKTGSPKNWSQV